MVSEMIDQYIMRFNAKYDDDEVRKNGDTRKINNFAKNVWNGYHYTVKRTGNFKIFTNSTYTVYEAEYEASSTEGILSSTSTFNGKFQVMIGTEEEDWEALDRFAIPVIVIKPGEDDKFAKKVMTFDQQFFDQPAAARYLTGLIHTINQYALREAGSVTINDAAEKLSLFFNCDDKEVSDEIISHSKFDKI